MEKDKLSENNLNAQVELMKSIINNYGTITYSIKEKANTLAECLSKAKYSDNMESVTIDAETFQNIMKAAILIQKEDRWEELTSISGGAINENRIKKEVLSLLQKTT